MNTLTFQNPGEIDPNAFIMFGWNAKPNSKNPIGFFGTGLKFGIAIAHRLGGKVTVYSGLDKYEFRLAKMDFRGTEQDAIEYRKGKGKWTQLGYGSNFGKTWEPWMAFRELYCNTKDEDGDVYNRKLAPEAGKTTIVIEGIPALVEAYEKRSAFMLDPNIKPISKSFNLEVYRGRSNGIYYKGILVGQTEKEHEFTYNLTSHVDLTEDRTMKHSHLFPHVVTAHWLRCGENEKEMLRTVVTGDRDSFEAGLPWNHCGYDPSDVFIEEVDNLRREGANVVDRVREFHDNFKPKGADPEAITLTAGEQRMLDEAILVIDRVLGYPMVRGAKIIPCRSLGPSTMGLAHKGRIFISKRAFEAGQLWVTGTLLEEFGHVSLSWRDESRDMQNSLINIIAGLGHRLLNRPETSAAYQAPVQEIQF